MIVFKNLHKYYNSSSQPLHVLKGIDLSIEKGELVSIMGASGSGKSTMLNIMGILDDYERGGYYLANQLIKGQTRKEQSKLRNELIGFIFQRYNLISFKNALENVALPLYYRGIKTKERNRIAMEYLERVGLSSHWNHLPNQLSGGQQQRVAIARALAMHPKIILADEPTGALDSKTSQEVMDMLIRTNKEEGVTTVIVTHERKIAEQTQRCIFLLDGKIKNDETL